MTSERVVVTAIVVLGLALYAVPAAIAFGPALVDGGGTSDAETEPPSDATGIQFEPVAEERGLVYESERTQPGMRGRISRSGAYVGDYDGDLESDVLVLGGERPVLYENDGGEFSESGALPALNESLDFRTALFVDYDNDGLDDLILAPLFGEPRLLRNDGGTYVRKPDAFDDGVAVPSSMTAADFDGDGCADVFVAQNGDWEADYPARVSSTEDGDNGKRNALFRGDCGSGFERAENVGLSRERWTLSTSAADFTGDGRPDIHAANDFNHDVLYVNQGDGTFTGADVPDTNRNGMASEVADVDGDGHLDLFVSNIYWTGEVRSRLDDVGVITDGAIGNNLLLNDGTGNFTSVEREYGVLNGRWGWAAVMTDLDNDGDVDLFHTTREQFVPEEVEEEWGTEFEYYQRSRLFERVERDRFEDRSARAAGLVQTDGRGVGHVDFDGDGGADLVVANADGRTRLYRNAGANGNAVQIVVQSAGNETVLGTEVTVITTDGREHQHVTAAADFLSQDTRVLHFGVGESDRVETIEIAYPDGSVATFRGECADQRLVVIRDEITDRRALTSNGTRSPSC